MINQILYLLFIDSYYEDQIHVPFHPLLYFLSSLLQINVSGRGLFLIPRDGRFQLTHVIINLFYYDSGLDVDLYQATALAEWIEWGSLYAYLVLISS